MKELVRPTGVRGRPQLYGGVHRERGEGVAMAGDRGPGGRAGSVLVWAAEVASGAWWMPAQYLTPTGPFDDGSRDSLSPKQG